jgi:hypothetical protein
MDWKRIAQIRAHTVRHYEQCRNWFARVPAMARIVFGLFLFAAVLLVLHTAMSGKDASLHLTLQHGFRSADVSLWIDGDLSYSGKLRGSTKRKFGLIPGAVHGSLSEIVPVSAGSHQIRVRVESEDGSTQQDSLTGEFARNTERELSVSASPNRLSLAWLATHAPGPSSGTGWLARYAGAVFLTIGGSIISALTGFALRELPAYLRERQNSGPKVQPTAERVETHP